MNDLIDDQTNDEVVDAEIVETENIEDIAAAKVLTLEQTIKTYYLSLEMKREEVKKQKDMVKDAFMNDQTLYEKEEKLKEAKNEIAKKKDTISQTSSVISAKSQIKNLSDEIKTIQENLSKFLIDYHDLSKMTQIEVKQGELYEIVQQAKLVKKNSKYKP